jgi:hypothetical protein
MMWNGGRKHFVLSDHSSNVTLVGLKWLGGKNIDLLNTTMHYI